MQNLKKSIPVVLLGFLMILFGLNKFLNFIPVDPPPDAVAQTFLGTMFTSYLFKIVAIGEITGGAFLLLPKYRLIGWLILSPIIFNIAAFHIAHDFIGNGIWLLPTILFIVISTHQIVPFRKAISI